MSDRDDRSDDRTQRRWTELLRAQEQQRLRAEDDNRRLRAQREELLRQWFARHLAATDPQPGQPHDTLLGDLVGDKSLLKRLTKMAAITLPIISLQPLQSGEWLLEARGRLEGTAQKAFRKLKKRAVGQMANHELPPAGTILDASLNNTNGYATITARVTEPTAALKVKHAAYPLVRLTAAGNEILAVDLVDTDALSKGASKGQVLAQLYQGEFMTSKKANKLAQRLGVPTPTPLAKAAPNSDARTLIQAALIPDAGDPQRRQLHAAAAIELIKASRARGPIADPRLRMTAGLR